MRIYLDDDSVDPLLIRLLRKAGHDVCVPVQLGLIGAADPVHLRHAIREKRVLLSGNHDDYRDQHELIREAAGAHPGISLVRRDNDKRRDLKPAGIVRAIANLLAAGVPIADNLHILNHWR